MCKCIEKMMEINVGDILKLKANHPFDSCNRNPYCYGYLKDALTGKGKRGGLFQVTGTGSYDVHENCDGRYFVGTHLDNRGCYEGVRGASIVFPCMVENIKSKSHWNFVDRCSCERCPKCGKLI